MRGSSHLHGKPHGQDLPGEGLQLTSQENYMPQNIHYSSTLFEKMLLCLQNEPTICTKYPFTCALDNLCLLLCLAHIL